MKIISRKKDKLIAVAAAEGAKQQYKEISGMDVEFTVDNSLSDTMCVICYRDIVLCYDLWSFSISLRIVGDRSGGVKVISGTGRITLDNTLDERLRLLEERVCTYCLGFTTRIRLKHLRLPT